MLVRPGVERVPMTREEYYRQAEVRENALVDWEEGAAIRLVPAHSRHGTFCWKLAARLDAHLDEVERGEVFLEVFVDFPTRTYGADLAVLFPKHLGRLKEGRIQGAPDIVVEVLSESSEERDRTVKFEGYWSEGVPWYWLGDPRAGTLEEYRQTPEGYLRTSWGSRDTPFRPQALPCLAVDLGELLE